MAKSPDAVDHLDELQDELRKAKDESSRLLQEVEEAKNTMVFQRNRIEDLLKNKDRAKMLEIEAKRAKESERKMLQSLAFQTKQLEQTKMSLEESKLEIRSLHECIKIMETSSTIKQNPKKICKWDGNHCRDETGSLKTELKLALEAEEKSKKAMDGLALAIKEVAAEFKQAKEKLSKTEIELGRSKEKLKLAMEESERLKLEAEESFAAWIEKENGFINCIKFSEAEITGLKEENNRLLGLQRAWREEISRLRDIVKQAVNEANVVKEALEIARTENSNLKDMVSEKKYALQSMKQEYECLKVSEAAAVGSVEELKGLIAATSNTTTNSDEIRPFPEATVHEVRVCKPIAKYPSEHWRREARCVRHCRRHSLGESGKFEGSIFEVADSGEPLVDKSRLSVDSDDRMTVIFKDIGRIDGGRLFGTERESDSPLRQKKRRQILRRFGDLLRRNFATSVHHA